MSPRTDYSHQKRRNWRALMPEILDYISMGYGRDEIASIMRLPRTTMDYQIDKVIPNEKSDRREARRLIRSKRYLGVPTKHVLQVDKAMTKEQLAAAKALIPKDTRDISARLCGEPLPGRSAWDKMQAEIDAIEGEIEVDIAGIEAEVDAAGVQAKIAAWEGLV